MRAEEDNAYYEKRADTRRFNYIKEIGNTGKTPHSAVEIEIEKVDYLKTFFKDSRTSVT